MGNPPWYVSGQPWRLETLTTFVCIANDALHIPYTL